MNPSGPGVLWLVGFFFLFITDSFLLLLISMFSITVYSWFNLERLNVSRNVSIFSRFSSLHA